MHMPEVISRQRLLRPRMAFERRGGSREDRTAPQRLSH